jgi:hypothetical protein
MASLEKNEKEIQKRLYKIKNNNLLLRFTLFTYLRKSKDFRSINFSFSKVRLLLWEFLIFF